MRIALISDIHGNAVALEAVLNELQTEHIDHIVCLGDTVADGPQPGEVIGHLKALNSSLIMGNMDDWFLNPQPTTGTSKGAVRGNEIRFWGVTQLSPDDLTYLRTFQATVEIVLDPNTTLLCYHGSPKSNEEGISSTRSKADLERMVSGYHATIFAGGHTHTQMIRYHNGITLFNPGSVGAPRSVRDPIPQANRDRQPAWAEYGIISCENGSLRTELRRVPVNVNTVKQAALNSGMPYAEWWTQRRYPLLDLK